MRSEVAAAESPRYQPACVARRPLNSGAVTQSSGGINTPRQKRAAAAAAADANPERCVDVFQIKHR